MRRKADRALDEIGGYFEWEMPAAAASLHPDALALKSGRSCVALLADLSDAARVWVPYYICDAALEPLRSRSVDVIFYGVDEQLQAMRPLPDLARSDRILYVDYFGTRAQSIAALESRYDDQLWVDHVQAFYVVPDKPRAFRFNSARKFFGVPDGAYLYGPASFEQALTDPALPANERYTLEHLVLRLAGETQSGRAAFEENEALSGEPAAAMSNLSAAMLERIDYSAAAERRRSNYGLLSEALDANNQLDPDLTTLGPEHVPFCYPYLPPSPIDKQQLWDIGIYVPQLWHECAGRTDHGFRWEKHLSRNLLPLPIDQRYGQDEMERIVTEVEALQ